LEQSSDRNLKGERDSENVSPRWIPARRLYTPKVRTVDARLLGEPLLRPALLLAQGTNPNSKPPDEFVIGIQPSSLMDADYDSTEYE
jgi:hypothetical protein